MICSCFAEAVPYQYLSMKPHNLSLLQNQVLKIRGAKYNNFKGYHISIVKMTRTQFHCIKGSLFPIIGAGGVLPIFMKLNTINMRKKRPLKYP